MERPIRETSAEPAPPAEPAEPSARPAVMILADDLIWSTRLVSMLRSMDVPARTVASLAAFDRALPAGGSAIVDLTARAYDGIEAVRLASGRGARTLCLVQHDDVPTRRAALAAGAARVVPYRTMHERGPETLRRWLTSTTEPAIEPAGELDLAPAVTPAPSAAARR